MTNLDRIKKALSYKQLIQGKIDAGVTPKHKNRAESYLAYLNNELRAINLKIESLRQL